MSNNTSNPTEKRAPPIATRLPPTTLFMPSALPPLPTMPLMSSLLMPTPANFFSPSTPLTPLTPLTMPTMNMPSLMPLMQPPLMQMPILQAEQMPSTTAQDSDTSQTSKTAFRAKSTSKQRDKWTDEEHEKFLEGVKLHDKDWAKIQELVKTKTIVQIRTHAQQYFQKAKDSTSPTRNKNKSQPYPAKKSDASATSEALAAAYLTNPAQLNNWMASPTGMLNTTTGMVNMPQIQPTGDQLSTDKLQKQVEQSVNKILADPDAASDDASKTVMSPTTSGNNPNYYKIYSLLASLFDPANYDPIPLMNKLNATDKECLRVLMHNLSISLSTQHFQEEYTATSATTPFNAVHPSMFSTSSTASTSASTEANGSKATGSPQFSVLNLGGMTSPLANNIDPDVIDVQDAFEEDDDDEDIQGNEDDFLQMGHAHNTALNLVSPDMGDDTQ